MPIKVIRGESTGIYREEKRTLEWEKGRKGPTTARDFRDLKRFFNRIFTRTILAEFDLLEKGAKRIIKAHGGTPGLKTRKGPDGRVIGGEWIPLPPSAPAEARRAKKLLFEIWSARDDYRKGKLEDGMLSAYRVGRRAEMVRVSQAEPAAKTGAKIRRAQRKGAAARRQIYERDYPALQAAVDKMARRNPNLSFTRISDLTGKRFGVSGHHVRNHTSDPRR